MIDHPASTEAAALLENPAEAGDLDDRAVSWLVKAQRVPPLSLIFPFPPWSLRAARVQHVRRSKTYSPRSPGRFAFVIPIVVENEIVDLAAWSPASAREPEQLSVRLGWGSMLGEDALEEKGIGTTGLPIAVYPNPLAWLKADRSGIVIVRWEPAAVLLAGKMVEPQGEAPGNAAALASELSRRLVVRKPIVVQRQSRNWQAAP